VSPTTKQACKIEQTAKSKAFFLFPHPQQLGSDYYSPTGTEGSEEFLLSSQTLLIFSFSSENKQLGRKMEVMAYQLSRLPYSDSLKLLEADIHHANALLVSFLSTSSFSPHFNTLSVLSFIL